MAEKCEWCNGTGRIHDSSEGVRTCAVCHGTGFRPSSTDDDPDEAKANDRHWFTQWVIDQLTAPVPAWRVLLITLGFGAVFGAYTFTLGMQVERDPKLLRQIRVCLYGVCVPPAALEEPDDVP